MLKTVIVLANGTEIYSGTGNNAIQSVTIKQQVNSAKQLTLGSVCASMLDVKIKSDGGRLSLSEGEEVTVYKVSDSGVRNMIGRFTLQKPTRPSANSMRITAYDRVTWLDKDIAPWLMSLTGWPYTLYNLAKMVCQTCGLSLVNTSIPNGDYQVQAFSAQNLTGRKLMQWIGEIAGRFCRATADGRIEFAWYTPSGVTITPNGSRFYYQNGLTYEDYQVATVEKVQIKLTQDDVGVVWPDVTGEKNTYIISGNYLLTTSSSSTILPLAQTLYEQLKGVTYTPCKVSVPAGLDVHAGNTVQITDRNGKTFTSYVMTKTQTGQRDTLECTGSQRRDSTTVVNNEGYKVLAGQLLEIKKDVQGLSVKASKIETTTENAIDSVNKEITTVKNSVANLELEADGISQTVSRLEETTTKTFEDINGSMGSMGEEVASNTVELTTVKKSMAALTTTAEGIVGSVSTLEQTTQKSIDETNKTIESLSKAVSAKMTPEAVELQIKKELENGTSKVTTSTGFTFDDDGLTVEKSGSEMKTQITEDGMTVYQNSEAVLKANNQGVDAKNLRATTYLMVGRNSRFEDYGSGRTGCFWIGG